MFGETVDYLLLRILAHRRNFATEEQLDARARRVRPLPLEAASPKLTKLLRRFDGHLPVDARLRYLDMGCGNGALTLALARLGVGHITGVDFLPRHIDMARTRAAALGASNASFVCADLHTWQPQEKFDVLLSFDAFEHIDRPREFLGEMKRFAGEGCLAAIAFGPLFHSPFGDHMGDFFRLQLPWRGLLFSEHALLRVRREYFRPTDPARRLSEVAGGLNQMRLSEFLEHVRATGWRFEYLAVNACLRGRPLLRRISDALANWPVTRDFIAHNVYAVIRPVAQ